MTNEKLMQRNMEEDMQVDRLGQRSEKGFSLIELIVAMVILAMLAAIVGPQVIKHVSSSKPQAAKIQIEEFGGALQMFALDMGRYPDTSEGLEALVRNPGNSETWNGPYLKKQEVPKDPWKKPYVYRCPGLHGDYDLFSLGPDGVEGGNDDIVSWK